MSQSQASTSRNGVSYARRRSAAAAGRVDSSDDENGSNSQAAAPNATARNGGEEDLDDLLAPLPKPQIDPAYANVPIGHEAAGSRNNTLVREWKIVCQKIEASLETLGNATSDYVEALSGSNAGSAYEEIETADANYRDLLDKLYEARVRQTAIEDQRHKVQLGERVADPFEAMEVSIKEKMDAYENKTLRQKYLTNEKYIAFRTGIWEASGEEGAMPNLKQVLAREEGDGDSSDEEVELQAGGQSYKDPLTKTWLKNPVRNSKCKHIYSKDVLVQYIKSSAPGLNQVQCPTAGCDKIIHINDLVEDKQLERRVIQQQRREEERGTAQQGTYQAIGDDDDDEDED